MKTIKKIKAIVLSMVLLVVGALNAQTTWNVDPSHSKIGFSVSHLVISEVEGQFKIYKVSLINNKEDFSDAKFSFEAEVASIDTGIEKRDGHLKSEDFFYAEKYPKITFTSTSIKKKSKNKYDLTGGLTMRGVTKKVVLQVTYGGTLPNDGYGNTKSGFSITGTIDRTDFGVAWNAKTETGGLTVGEEVELDIKLEMVKSK